MSKMIQNLTLPIVLEEIEQVLETYPDHPYQQAFANPDTRQQLIAFVLTRVRNVYTVIDEAEATSIKPNVIPFSADKLLSVEDTIHKGIQTVLGQCSETITQQIPEVEDPGLMASHWFG